MILGFGWEIAARQRNAHRIPVADNRVTGILRDNCEEAGRSTSLLSR